MATRAQATTANTAAGIADAPRQIEFDLSRQLHMLSAPTSPQAESLRVLRTYLTTQHVSDGRRTLAVCATAREAGCTYIAANLALAFAQTGLKVLLIDCNMRNPGVDSLIAPRTTVNGLLQYLANPNALAPRDVIFDDVVPNLSVAFSGGASDAPQELLGGNAFKALIDSCVRDYDLTIADTPAANTCSDARRIGAILRYGLIVTRRNQSYVSDVRTLASELRGDRVQLVGTYLNDY